MPDADGREADGGDPGRTPEVVKLEGVLPDREGLAAEGAAAVEKDLPEGALRHGLPEAAAEQLARVEHTREVQPYAVPRHLPPRWPPEARPLQPIPDIPALVAEHRDQRVPRNVRDIADVPQMAR